MGTRDFDLQANLKGLKINDDKKINILLFGESGMGKSTLINSVANYLSFKNISQAEDNLDELTVLIRSQFEIRNKDNRREEVTVGTDDDDENEHIEFGKSATQDVKAYLFPICNGQTKVQLIDTPGIGDTRGPEQDNENIEKILDYIGSLKELHAICLIFNPSNRRISPYFEYCLQEILSRLNKSASRNLVFLFTNSKGSNFDSGDTFSLLRVIRNKIKTENKVDILLDENENVFCFENDAFKYLAALKQGVEFSKEQREDYMKSWKQSSKECLRLISYIVGDEKRPPLAPHLTQGTVSINEARRLITNLSQPLADITQLIQDNINVLQRHQRTLSSEEDSLTDLKKRLYIPVVNLKVTELTQPVTVCTSSKCATNIRLEGVNLTHYGQRCHEPCYLTTVKGNQIGDAGLVNCACIDQSTKSCKKCTCDFSIHMHVYYLTTPVSENKEDAVVKGNILNREEAIKSKNKLIVQIDQRRKEFEKEREKIVSCAAQFAHFLQNNAITPINDCYETYIKYLIKREEGLGTYADQETLDQLNKMLDRYREIRQTFDKSLERRKQPGDEDSSTLVDAETIKRSIQNLYQLRHTGAKIEELVEKQTLSRKSEHDFLCKTVDLKHRNDRNGGKKPAATATSTDAGGKQYKKKPFDPKKGNNYAPNKQKFNNQRPRDQSGHRSRDRSTSRDHRQPNYGPPPPYEHVQAQQPPFHPQQPPFHPQQPPFHPQQPPFHPQQPHYYGTGHGHSHGHGPDIEVKINNQNPCRDPHCHQCTNNWSQPPQSGFPGYVPPQTGYPGPQSAAYPGPQYNYPGPHGPQGGHGGGPHGGFTGHQQQNRPGFNHQNKQYQNKYPQGKQGGGPKYNNGRPQNKFDDQSRPNKYQNQQNDNRNQKFDNNNRNQGGGPQNKPYKPRESRPNNQNQNQNQQRPNRKPDNQNDAGKGGNPDQGKGEQGGECVVS